MAKHTIRGKFFYEDEDKKKKKSKKELRKEQKKLLKAKDKEIEKRCECNHLDRKHNKTHFKTSDDGNHKICKICGGKIIANANLMTPEIVEAAVETIYSVLSIARNRLNVSEEMDEAITNALRINSRTPDLIEMLKQDTSAGKKKKKKNGKNGKKKGNKKKNKFYRVNY